MVRKRMLFMFFPVLLATASCITRYSGTKYEQEVPLAGYLAGAAGIAGGLVVGGMSAVEVLNDDVDWTSFDHRIGSAAGIVMLAGGIAAMVISIVWHARNRPAVESEEYPVPPIGDPRWHPGQYAVEKASGSKIYIVEVHPQHDWDEANKRYIPRIYYWVCAHAGPSAHCWWRTEEELDPVHK